MPPRQRAPSPAGRRAPITSPRTVVEGEALAKPPDFAGVRRAGGALSGAPAKPEVPDFWCVAAADLGI